MPTAPRAPTAPRCLNDVVRYPGLEWLSLRRDGQSCAYIAHRAGVSEEAVSRATKAYGPFPRPSKQLDRKTLSDDELSERQRRWVEQRRRGRTVTAIAAEEGVAHQYVSQATRDQGPYPSREAVEEWVDARRAGKTSRQIADERNVSQGLVTRETRPHGPFRGPGHPLPGGVMGVGSIAREVGLSPVTVLRWKRTGRLPQPDFVTAKGRPLWLPGTVAAWLEDAELLSTCEACGARCLSVSRHVAMAHRPGGRERAPGRPAAREQTIPSE